MATDLKSLTVTTQEQLLKAISAAQTSVLDGVESWTSAVQKLIPGNLPSLSSLPGADVLPTPAETVALGYEFAEKLLTSQKEFAEQLFATGMAQVAPKPAAKR
jgi:hypothetical protein